MGPFACISADPPWAPKDELPGPKRGASKHYGTMSTDEICRIVLPPIADNALLFLWRLASMPADALAVCHAWGFTPKTEVVWVKLSRNARPDSRKLAFGMGHSFRAAHETAIVATRGKTKALIKDHSIRSVFFAPVRRHSQKPDEFYSIVEKICDGPRLEVFGRVERPGWQVLGDELGKPVTVRPEVTAQVELFGGGL